MQFDRFTVTLLIHNPDGPRLDDESAAALQNGHMAHLADLHAQGHLLRARRLRLEGYSISQSISVHPVPLQLRLVHLDSKAWSRRDHEVA